MLMVKTGSRVGKLLLLVGFLVAGLAGPALAGNVWSWVTDDGTHSFTDDPKRIPARYRSEALSRPMEKLQGYKRFTEVRSELEMPYAERLRERQTMLREREARVPEGTIAGADSVSTQGSGVVYATPATGGRGRAGSGASIMVPLARDRSDDARPTTIESIRVKPRDSLASRHWTVVKQGDRLVTVIKGELRQRPLDGPSESEFDL